MRGPLPLSTASRSTLATLPSLDDFDGDLPSPSSILLLLGGMHAMHALSDTLRTRRIEQPPTVACECVQEPSRSKGGTPALESLSPSLTVHGDPPPPSSEAFGSAAPQTPPTRAIDRAGWTAGGWLRGLADPLGWPARVLFTPAYLAGHLMLMLVPLQLLAAVGANPLTCAAVWLAWGVPVAWWRRAAEAAVTALADADERSERLVTLDHAIAAVSVLSQSRRVIHLAAQGMGLGLHTWMWLGTMWLLLVPWRPDGGSPWVGLLYLTVAELCLHGFAFHPYLGFFLGVHRSRRHEQPRGAPPPPSCQPTMSTYSLAASLGSLYLNYHVEHHDMPNVPWSRLPRVRALAPEFYKELESSPGFVATIGDWLRHGHQYSYACHGAEALTGSRRPGSRRPAEHVEPRSAA